MIPLLIGAAAGAAAGWVIGALLEDDPSPAGGATPVDLPVSLFVTNTKDGRHLIIEPEREIPDIDGYVVHLYSHRRDSYVRGREPFRDDEGDFVAWAPADPDTGLGHVFVPLGAARVKESGPHQTQITAISETDVLGHAVFELRWNQSGPLEWHRLYRPLVQLAKLVASQNSEASDSEVLAILTEHLGLEEQETSRLRSLWKDMPVQDAEELAEELGRRLGGTDPMETLRLLTSIAAGHGPASHPARAVIRSTALGFGLDPQDWPDLERELRLDNSSASADGPSPRDVAWAYRELGLAPDAEPTQVRAARIQLIKQYHPDTVANLAPGFQQYATEKTKDINDAYRIVLEHLRSGGGYSDAA